MAEENLTFLEAKRLNSTTFANAVNTNSRFQILGQLSNSDFPPLPPRRNARDHNNRTLTTSQPVTKTPQIQTDVPLSQPEIPNKKRKALSVPSTSTYEPMFPFSFGPRQPLPPNQNKTPDESTLDMMFDILQKILNEANSFEDLAKIDIEYVNEIVNKTELDKAFSERTQNIIL
nr:unnamed protein product [Callosobruchus analis]